MLDFFIKKINREDIPTEYDDYELGIEKLLHNKAESNLDEGYEEFDDVLGGKSVRSLTTLGIALATLNKKCSNVQTGDVNVLYGEHVENAIHHGSYMAGWGQNINYALSKESVRDGIVKISGYYSNKYFNDIVIPMVQNGAEKAVNKQASSREVYDEVRKVIDQHYKSVNYWRLVANNSASIGYHYGLLKGAEYTGYTKVVYRAVMDSRTSDICRKLNGTEWPIRPIVDNLERAMTADDIEMKDIKPWLTLKDYESKTKQEWEASGIICAPQHPQCRSTMELY